MAQAAGQQEWFLDILVDDLGAADDALDYLRSLPRQEAAKALLRHGKVLVKGHCTATSSSS